MAEVFGDDAILCTGKTIVWFPGSLSTSAHVQYAVALMAFLATWVPEKQIQRGQKMVGYYAPENYAALVKSISHRSRRFTTASDEHEHRFMVEIYYVNEGQANRFDTPANIGETIMKALERNKVDFGITGHRDTEAVDKTQDEKSEGTLPVHCIVEVTFKQEVAL
jgi:hypothetical protein